ncbi:MAG: hypothetical protein WB588_03440 [Dehalococcoidia bacterium]
MHSPTTWLNEWNATLHKAIFHLFRSLLPEGKPAFKDGEVNFHITVNGITDKKTFVLDQKWYPLASISYEKVIKNNPYLDNKMVANWDDVRFSQDISEIPLMPVLN